MRQHIDHLNKAIQITFYTLFLTVPLAMHPNTSELFELNKMWLVYIYSIIIFFLWGTKILIQRRFEIKRTPFDIPLALFFASQLIATIISIDAHTSFWGYYSRFNGGFLSTICYLFLFYAFATNMLTKDPEENKSTTRKSVLVVLFSGVLVALWGLPSHFGYDPTCLVFRGTLDVSCWTEAFQPKVRIFSTLGQPNWLAAFFLILVPIASAFTIQSAKKVTKSDLLSLPLAKTIGFLLITILLYLDLVWTLSQSGFVGFWVGNMVFFIIFLLLIIRSKSHSPSAVFRDRSFQVLVGIQMILIFLTFTNSNPIPRFQKYSLVELMAKMNTKNIAPAQQQESVPSPTPEPVAAQPALESGITDSGGIRKIVWKGAIDVWKANPLIGSGVETFAFAYYKHRPQEHNLTSEWDYLYNKAHNEFLNYLSTTGIFGLGSYLAFIFLSLFISVKYFLKLWKKKLTGDPLLPALSGAIIGISISNFFGFSVVLVNLLLFLIPLFFWALTKPESKFTTIPAESHDQPISSEPLGTGRIMTMIGLGGFSLYCLIFLINYWNADVSYALGYNYNRINAFTEANPHLEKAVSMRGGEDLYKNELSINLAALALLAAQQNNQELTAQLATRAKTLSDEVAQSNPNNVVYWKARTRVIFSLAELSPPLLNEAVAAIEKSSQLAPTDAKVLYNQGLIFDQVGRKEEALQKLDKAISLKANYRDAYYAKGLFLSQAAEAEQNPTKKQALKEEATKTLEFIITNISPTDQQSKDLLETLK